MELSTRVKNQALHPFRELLPPAGFEVVEREGIFVSIHPLPFAKIVEPANLRVDDVADAIRRARSVVRARGASLIAWWITPEYAAIGRQLAELGLTNEDTPGFESVEDAMALTEEPTGSWPRDVVVTEVESFDDFQDSSRVMAAAFDVPEVMRDEMEASLPEQYEEYATPGNSARQFNASIDGLVVGTATAVRGPAGVNLFGGGVLSEARGRGVYRALTHARWRFAVDHGTPALTIQAGRMSRPIAESLGFILIEQVAVFVDDFAER